MNMAITMVDYSDAMANTTTDSTELAAACIHGNIQPMHGASYTVHRTHINLCLVLNEIQALNITFESVSFVLLGCEAM
jgi:hypothetical protein